MRTETIKKTYKLFEDLTEEEQQPIIEENYYWNVEYIDWWDFTLDYWKEKLVAIGFIDPEIYFSHACRQGDGACFTASVDAMSVLETLAMCVPWEEARFYFAASEAVNNGLCEVGSITHSGMYYHEYTMDLDYSSFRLQDCVATWSIVSSIQEILELAKSLSRDIFDDLVAEYDYLTSEEAIRESLISNEYEILVSREVIDDEEN